MTSKLLLISAFAAIAVIAVAALTLVLIRTAPEARPSSMIEAGAPAGRQRAGEYLDIGRAVVVGATGHPIEHACRACHGMEGAGDSSGAIPRISELEEWYLYKQLHDFADGTRPSDVMTPIARALSELERRGVSHYYAAQSAPFPARPEAAPLTLQTGGAIAAVGIPERGVTPCTSCHGPRGFGVPPVNPQLAGQYAPYTVLQLDLFRRSVRRNDPAAVMRTVAENLSDEEISALALYYESIRPPAATAQAAP